MHIVIVGGGKTGSFLGQLLVEAGHAVCIVERRPEIVSRLVVGLPAARIVRGDGTSPSVLRESEIHRADVAAAVTGEDEDNLAIALLARNEYHVPRTIARINNPKNAWMYTKEMGVDMAVNEVGLMARLIQEEISMGEMVALLKLHRGELTLVEEKLEQGSHAVGKPLSALSLPAEALLIAIVRRDEALLARPDIILESGDELLALAKTGTEFSLEQRLR